MPKFEEKKNKFQKKNRFKRRREKPEFEQRMIDLARVTRVVKGGRRFSFRASMVIGNRKGKVGFGVAKGSDVSTAISKAVANAKKNMITVKKTNTTIAFDIREKFGAGKVLLRPVKEGRGIVAGGAMRAVFELAGIKDVVAKSLGSSNKINVAQATLKALERLSETMTGAEKKEKEMKERKEKKEKAEKKSAKKTAKKSEKKVGKKTEKKKKAPTKK